MYSFFLKNIKIGKNKAKTYKDFIKKQKKDNRTDCRQPRKQTYLYDRWGQPLPVRRRKHMMFPGRIPEVLVPGLAAGKYREKRKKKKDNSRIPWKIPENPKKVCNFV